MEQFSYQHHCINFSTVFQETTLKIFIYQSKPESTAILSTGAYHLRPMRPRNYSAVTVVTGTITEKLFHVKSTYL